MTHIRLLLILLLLPALVWAQEKEYPHCQRTYFRNSKKVSTTQCYDANDRWGRAQAFDKAGKQIYEWELRRIAGHSSVQFSYYDDGAVKKAEWSSAPDGGIQWYRSTTLFDEDGRVTSETKDSYDDGPGTQPYLPGTTRKTLVTPTPPPPPSTPTVATCAVIYSSEFWFVNETPYTVEVAATRNNNEHSTVTLKPKQRMKGGYMPGAERFEDPSQFYKFSVRPVKAGVRKKFIIIPSDKKPEQPTKEVRRYYYEVRRIV